MKLTSPTNTNRSQHLHVKQKKWTPRISIGQQTRRINLKTITENKIKIKKRFVCEKCNLKFAAWWEIRDHWRSTGHKDPQECRWCIRKTFTLQSHLCKQHWQKAVMCKYCGQLFMFREDLEAHMHYHGSLQYRCYLCGRRRSSAGLLRAHVYGHYVHEKYSCNLCEKRFKQKKNMEKHLRNVHFICQYCGSTQTSLSELKKHVRIHDDLFCLLCHKKFSQKNRLKYHYQLQHGHQDFYKCSICFQRCATKMRLLDHYKLKHGGVAKYSCKICKAPFLYWQHYKNHFERKHAKPIKDGERFSCSSCSFKTNLKCKMQWHVEKTSGDGFFCKKCQVPLQCKGLFDLHMEKHKGEKMWTCGYCPKSYKSDNTLKHHMSVYHKDIVAQKKGMVYPCLVNNCSKFYTNKNSLARHVRRAHEGNGSIRSTPAPEGKEPWHLPPGVGHLPSSMVSRSPSPVTDEELGPGPSTIMQGRLDNPLANEVSSKQCCDSVTDLKKTVEVNAYVCDTCQKMWTRSKYQFIKHMSSHGKLVWEGECDACNLTLETPEEAIRHNVEDHLKVRFVEVQ